MSLSVDIKKDYGAFRLQIKLEQEGGILGLLGASGSGKSLTLKFIAGILTPDEGKILLNEKTLYDSERKINLPPQKRGVGYLFQNYALFPHMTVEQNILCGLNRMKDQKVRLEKMEEALEVFQIQDVRKKYPAQLSGGQQQRAAFARILVSEPELLLLDEPFSALDAYLRDRLQIQVKDILREFGKDTILVSHSRDEIYRLTDRTVLLDQGAVLEQGDTKQVFARPRSSAGAILTGCKNIASARKTGEYEVEVPEWGICLRVQEPVPDQLTAVGIRAHRFSMEERENRYPVRIVDQMEEPFEWTILFQYENQRAESTPVWWRISKKENLQLMPDHLGIGPGQILLLDR